MRQLQVTFQGNNLKGVHPPPKRGREIMKSYQEDQVSKKKGEEE